MRLMFSTYSLVILVGEHNAADLTNFKNPPIHEIAIVSSKILNEVGSDTKNLNMEDIERNNGRKVGNNEVETLQNRWL